MKHTAHQQKKAFTGKQIVPWPGIILAVLMLIWGTSYVYAQWGGGYHDGRGMGYHHGWSRDSEDYDSRYQEGRWQGRGWNRSSPWTDITQEQAEKLQSEKEKFYNDTKELRQSIYEKEMSLLSELVKRSPDEKILLEKQKTISDEKAKLEEARIKHILRMKEIAPDSHAGYWGMYRGKGCGGPGPGCPWR